MVDGDPVDPHSVMLRRLALGDAEDLATFYNGLSEASKRTFCPLGVTVTVETCAGIVRQQHAVCANTQAIPAKYDLVAVCGAEIVGWSFLWDLAALPDAPGLRGDGDTDDGRPPTFGLAVADAYQGRGLGTALISKVMEWARDAAIPEVLLTVVQDNTIARRLYERAGFVCYGEFVGDDGLPYYRMRAEFGRENTQAEIGKWG